MYEPTASARTRDAIRTAHEERGRAIAHVFGWLFRPFSR